MLFINCSNQEKNCYNILKRLQTDNDKLISLSNKKMSFCLGCQCCQKDLPNHCVLNDYITNKGVKYGKNSPLTNGNYYIEGKNFYSKNNNFHLPVIPKGSNNFNNHYNLFSYNKKLDYY